MSTNSLKAVKDFFRFALNKGFFFIKPYWRQLLLLFFLGSATVLEGLGLSALYAGLAWLAVIVLVDIIIVYNTRDYWLWPAVRMIEVNWYGRTLDKEGTTEAERKAWRKKNKFMVGEKEK